jgi:hypothetical protein
MRLRPALAALGAALLCAACAGMPPTERRAARLASFMAYAGPPVEEVRGFTLTRFEVVGPSEVVFWVRVSEIYLVTVQPHCPELTWANRIGVRQSMNVLRPRFDAITVRGIDCRIREIRPVDGERWRASQHPADRQASAGAAL